MERDQASKFINDLLKLMVSRNGSDLFITGEFPARHQGGRQGHQGVAAAAHRRTHTLALARSIMNDKQVAEFERTKECNFAISPRASGAFASMPLCSRARSAWCCG
jgi:twitching motility protein PilU